jgi:DNA processing protein
LKKNKSISEDKLFWLAFSSFKINCQKFLKLIDFFGSAKEAFLAEEGHLLEVGLKENEIKRLVFFRKTFSADSYYVRLCENQIECYFLDSNYYPKLLKNIDNPPFVLYCKGKILKKDQKALAVVGSRNATFYGKSTAEAIVLSLVKRNFTIVSGGALGIDSAAHKAAISYSSGRTIAVLGCGLDFVYPPENKDLFEEISQKGAVVSEFGLGEHPLANNFPERNRIISGLSLGVVVIEAKSRSGTLITARLAGEQGREVFVVPGPITSQNTAGIVRLANNGAKLIYSTKDILEEFEEKNLGF